MAAAAARMEDTTRDIDDLREAKVSVEEFDAALAYVTKYHQPDDAEFIAYQKRDISELRRVLFDS